MTRAEAEHAIMRKLGELQAIMNSYSDEDYTLALYVTRGFLGAYSHGGIRAVIDCQMTTKGGTDGGETEVPAD